MTPVPSAVELNMMPLPPYDFWYTDPPDVVTCECLMPTGHIIQIIVSQDSSFAEIKEELWDIVEQRKLNMTDKSEYTVQCISTFGTKSRNEAITDESKRLSDIQPYFCLLQVVRRKKDTDNQLEKHITELIDKPLQEFNNLNNPEVNDFRYKMGLLTESISAKRKTMTFQQKLNYQFPPRLADSKHIPDTVRNRMIKGNEILLEIRFENDHQSHENTGKLKVAIDMQPNQILDAIFKKGSFKRKKEHTDYVLKVYGQNEYIYGDRAIIEFQYVQDILSQNGTPSFVTQPTQNVALFSESIYQVRSVLNATTNDTSIDKKESAKMTPSTFTLKKRQRQVSSSSWEIEQQFQLSIQKIKGLNCDVKSVEVAIQVGLFHGGKSLCEPQKTTEVSLSTDGNAEWNEVLKFDIMVYNVPRMARLCLVVYEIAKSSKSGGGRRKVKDTNKYLFNNPLAWVNTTIFDYKNQLKTGAMTLYTWTYAEDSQSDDMLHPLGTVESNPRTDERAAIMLSIYNYNVLHPIIYPSDQTVFDYANELRRSKKLNRDSAQDKRSIKEIMAYYLNTDRIHDMVDQDRSAIWDKRFDCLKDLPDGLPCLLQCVQWNDRDEVAEMRSLLGDWPQLSEERALELLDYAYADSSVREFAVNCIKKLNGDELLLYLLQLVQAMKHESYFMCPLVEFLLDRALNNQRIGQNFFWHLRSEMQVPSIQIRFGIILEAYLKGAQEHIPILLKQKTCLDQLKKGSEQAKKGSKEKGRHLLQEFLNHGHVQEKLSNVLSPLNPSFYYKKIKPDQCKVMDSKMRPLWVVFENADKYADEVCVIFKNGDDLRQDMLTLQMLRVMDRIWKSHGLDFRMNPYSCVSTEHGLGMIEVVLKAETIANIQKKKGMFSATSPFKKGSLLAWLKDHNETEVALDTAIHEFTLSCAGYCVATYVLGVADRHSDNIMVKETGQLFHIDFGHILGHFKEKFGFRRERVPFVLTHDFVYIINKGKTDRETDEFKTFKNLCETGFLLLRQHGCLILSLFAMMISTGLPELSSEKDLNYLRETLVLDLSEKEARLHFQAKFSEALVNSWKTSLNWASHNFSKNNKQ